MSGMDLPLAVMITIPAPWEHDRYMRQEIKDFYRYYATMMEPWDGPTSILFTDGEILGAEKYAAEGFGLELDGRLRVKTKNDGHRTQFPESTRRAICAGASSWSSGRSAREGMPRERSMRT